MVILPFLAGFKSRPQATMGVALLAQHLNNRRFQLGFGELHILFPVLSGRAPARAALSVFAFIRQLLGMLDKGVKVTFPACHRFAA